MASKRRKTVKKSKLSPRKQGSEGGTTLETEEDFIDLVYPSGRYSDKMSPLSIYIPNEYVLYNIMRACLSVNKIEELWIYK